MLTFLISLIRDKSSMLVGLLCVGLIGATLFIYQQNNSLLSENARLVQQLAECKATSSAAQSLYEANLAAVEIAITNQNAKISALESATHRYQTQIDQASAKINQLRLERDALIDKLKQTPAATLDCSQSIELLYHSVPTVTWQPLKGTHND